MTGEENQNVPSPKMTGEESSNIPSPAPTGEESPDIPSPELTAAEEPDDPSSRSMDRGFPPAPTDGITLASPTAVAGEQASTPDDPLAAVPRPSAGVSVPVARIGLHPALFGFLVVVVTFFTYQLLGAVLTLIVAGAGITEENLQHMRVMTVISQILFLMVPAVVALRFQRWPVRESLRLRAPRADLLVLVSLGVISLQFVFQSYTMAQDYLLTHYLIPESMLPLFKKFTEFIEGIYLKLMAMRSPAELLLVVLVVAVTPAVCEEVLFRGVVQDAFLRGMRTRWAFVFTAVIFALFHVNPMTFIPVTALGLFFSVIVWRGGSLFLSIAAHAVNNAFAVLSLYFGGDETAVMHDITVSPSFSSSLWMSAVALAVFIVCMAMFWKRTHPESNPVP